MSLGGGASIGYHRLKFFLMIGDLPPKVDHRDGDTRNNLGSNLRAATQSQNMANQPLIHQRRALPRGVYPRANGRYQAKAWDGKKYTSLGTYADPVEASRVVEEFLRPHHGEFYVPPHGD